ncbi:MAG TPA: response regulator transcription factor [Dehalococcoidales bacterium]|nr:response regulator transcription factor [Dehalococcoidales bacterium]
MRVLVADKHPDVRSALTLALEEKAGLEIVGEAADVKALHEYVRTARPELVILEWELAAGGMRKIIADLRTSNPGLKIIVLSAEPQVRNEALKSGVTGFVCKSDPPETLIKALESLRIS